MGFGSNEKGEYGPCPDPSATKLKVETRWLLLALSLSPLSVLPAAIVYFFALSMLSLNDFFSLHSAPSRLAMIIFSGSFLAVFGIPIAYAVEIIYLLPVYLLLRSRGHANAWTICAAGFLPCVGMALFEKDYIWSMSLYYGYFGVVVASAFWWLAVRKGVAAIARQNIEAE